MHVRYKSLYISLPFSAKKQREGDHVLRILENANCNGQFFVSTLELNAVGAC